MKKSFRKTKIVKEKIKHIIGNILITVLPNKAEKLSKSGMTIMNHDKFGMADRLMRNALIKKAEKNKDFDTLAKFQRDYWVNQGTDFFLMNDGSFENAFLPDCAFIFDLLEEELSKDSEQFHTLVEIGTGNGKVLNYLGDKFPQIDKLIGIDLSPEQIELNTKQYRSNSRLEFIATDGFEWAKENGKSNMIFVTSRGVLEYFTEKRLQEFFTMLNGFGPMIFVAIEPNGVDHDFAVNAGSQPYGHERSFSHNYSALFKKAGFEFWHYSKKELSRDDFFFRFIGAKN